MKLVDDWKRAWRWFSVWCMSAAGAIDGTLAVFPEAFTGYIPHQLLHVIATISLILGIIGRIIKQPVENKL